jgi:site-specific DNA-methyltransferase (adenine-specific)
MLELNNIYHLDCIKGMEDIDAGSVDLLLTDPPYNISMRSGFHTMGRQGVDFGKWDRGFDQRLWLRIACEKIKKGGSAVIFNDYKNIGIMDEVLNECGLTVKELLIWQKPNPMPRNRDRLYVTTIEVALWAVKGKGWTFNRKRTNYENAIFPYSTVNPRVRKHTTEKPEGLVTELLKIHSNEGDLILDPFSGSGVVSAMAFRHGRNCIGFEIDENYFKISDERLKNEIQLTHGVFI